MRARLAQLGNAALSPKGRAYLYRVSCLSTPLLISYGVVNDAQAALWLGLGNAILGLGTAAGHTSTKGPAD